MNVFYQEILVSADPDRGISFTSCLMILAHYNVIDDTKSLRLDEFLKRRARLQRVQESIRRDIVIGFFDMMYEARRFRREQNLRKYSNLAGPVQLAVPEIFVEDPDDSFESSDSIQPRDFTEGARSPSSALGPDYGTTSSRSAPRIDTTLRRRDSARTPSPTASEISPSRSPSPTPGLEPNRLFAADTSYGGAERPRSNSSRLGHSRRGSAVSAQGVLDSFDNSAWGDSLRRSFSTRRPSYS
jgi:voltage-dependent calcium channel